MDSELEADYHHLLKAINQLGALQKRRVQKGFSFYHHGRKLFRLDLQATSIKILLEDYPFQSTLAQHLRPTGNHTPGSWPLVLTYSPGQNISISEISDLLREAHTLSFQQP